MKELRARLRSTLKSRPAARAMKRRLDRAREHWHRKSRSMVRRWVYRTPDEVVKSNTRRAFDYFFAQDEFIETDYLRESRLRFYESVADHCVPLLTGLADGSGPCRVMDVGCGTGHFLLALQRRLGDHAELSGLDFSSVAIARARAVVPSATLRVANAYELPFPDGFFDAVTCIETLEHLKKPKEALAEMARICRPGGHLIITVPDGDVDDWDGHVSFWTAASLRELLTSLGSGVHEVTTLSGEAALLAHTTMPMLDAAARRGSRSQPALTVFSVPKPFVGHLGVIQMNALRSWTLLKPECQIIIFGDEPGIAEAAGEIGALHVAEVERNHLGTPRLDWVFDQAQKLAEHRLMCYLNSDIIARSDLPRTAAAVGFPQFLMLGERTDLEVTEPLDFGTGWQERLRRRVLAHGSPHGPTGMDYFVFPTGTVRDMPGFVVGRAGWDNWMVYNARARRIPVIDATRAVGVVHQAHDYTHQHGPRKGTWLDAESVTNRRLVDGGFKTEFLLSDATWRITRPGAKPVRSWCHLRRARHTLPHLYPPEHYPLLRPLAPVNRLISRIVMRWGRRHAATKSRAERTG